MEFVVVPHKDSKDVYILGTTEEVQATLDESNINVNTISASRHVGPIKSRVDEWAKFLDRFSKTMVSNFFYSLAFIMNLGEDHLKSDLIYSLLLQF